MSVYVHPLMQHTDNKDLIVTSFPQHNQMPPLFQFQHVWMLGLQRSDRGRTFGHTIHCLLQTIQVAVSLLLTPLHICVSVDFAQISTGSSR